MLLSMLLQRAEGFGGDVMVWMSLLKLMKLSLPPDTGLSSVLAW
jgi:hypothetical protein